jgi:hypothetical protein
VTFDVDVDASAREALRSPVASRSFATGVPAQVIAMASTAVAARIRAVVWVAPIGSLLSSAAVMNAERSSENGADLDRHRLVSHGPISPPSGPRGE